MPDYLFPGVTSPGLATAAAGFVGTVVAFVLAIVLARVLSSPTDRKDLAGA